MCSAVCDVLLPYLASLLLNVLYGRQAPAYKALVTPAFDGTPVTLNCCCFVVLLFFLWHNKRTPTQ